MTSPRTLRRCAATLLFDQTEQKLRNEQVRGQDAIINAHFEVGHETRQTIERIGGTRPEDLPPEPSIRPVLDKSARQRKKLPPPGGPPLFDATEAAE